MIYLRRDLDRAACETEERAARLEAQGWVRCSAQVHAALWRIADVTALAKMRSELPEIEPPQPAQEKEVGKLPPGFVRTSLGW